MSHVSDVQLISDIFVANYATVAFVMILLYDYVLTFGEEVEFIWRQKMNFGNLLFLLNRYIPMIDVVIFMNAYTNSAVQQREFCLPWFRADAWIKLFSYVIINILFLLRTWALWKMSRTILICLSVLLVGCILTTSGTMLYETLTASEIPSINSIRPCLYYVPKINILYIYSVSVVVFDSAVVILTLIKIVPARQSNGLTPVITQLLKDGVLYFAIIFLIAVSDMILTGLVPAPLLQTVFTSYTSMSSTLGSRMILNLHGSILRPAYGEEDMTISLNTLVSNNHPNGRTITRHDLM